MSEELYDLVAHDIASRTRWEVRQGLWYQMRNDGLRRKHKPWPNAADAHFPLIDTTINKLKPGFFQQAMGLEVLATFVPMRQQMAGFTSAAEQWFSYKLHEKSNYAPEVMSWIDHMLMSGHSAMKTYWNPDKKQIEFQSIDPMYLIVPPWTKGVEDSDRMCQVMPMSLESYKRAGIYDDSTSTINSIMGGKTEESGILNDLKDKRELREGLTFSTDKEQVIVWEVYSRDEDGEWEMYCFSPQEPSLPLRKKMKVPFDHGTPPFSLAKYEITDGGWYSPRGVPELLASFESSLNKSWNEKQDAATLFNKPLFRAERDLPNSVNLRLNPGQILPFGIAPVQMPDVPLDFDKEMAQTQSVAEQRVTVPDYGIMADRDRRTATEIESINAQSQQNMDLRLRLFRQALGDLFRQAWSVLLQFDSKDLQYRFLEDNLMVDPVALHDEYQIEPRGGMDMVSRAMLLNRAIQRKQLFVNSPWINQVELDKSILELEDPSLVQRLVEDPNQKEGMEVSDEKKIIPALLIGEMIPVEGGQDFRVRIGVIMQFLEKSRQTGMQVAPQGQQAISSRLGELLNAYEELDTNNARALRKDVEEYLVQLGFMPSKEEQGQMEVQAMTGQMPQEEAQMVEETEAVVQQGDY
tara:strand:- start:1342 stop:3246 length:1905 start_codon:yes stop_codon:yes gene_type:complete